MCLNIITSRRYKKLCDTILSHFIVIENFIHKVEIKFQYI